MSPLALTAEDVLAWHEQNTAYWRQLLTDHPEALALPCDIAGTKSAGELLQHIVAVELRYAERLAGLPATDYAAIPFDSVASIYATHDRSAMLFRNLLATTEPTGTSASSSSPAPWAQPVPPARQSSSTHCSTENATTHNWPPFSVNTELSQGGQWTTSSRIWRRSSSATSSSSRSPQLDNDC